MEADPGFTDAGVVGHLDSLVSYIRKIGVQVFDNPWHYELNFPPTWPLPENLAYSNTALQSGGSDGFALGDLNWFPDQKAQWLLTSVEKADNNIPERYTLSEAYPNPFNPETNFKFSIPNNGMVKITIYNLLGQEVKTLLNSELTAGSYTAKWDATDDFGTKVSSGVYFYRLDSGSFNATKKMVLMK